MIGSAITGRCQVVCILCVAKVKQEQWNETTEDRNIFSVSEWKLQGADEYIDNEEQFCLLTVCYVLCLVRESNNLWKMPSLGFLNAFRFDEERVQFLAYCKESTRKFLAWCEHVLGYEPACRLLLFLWHSRRLLETGKAQLWLAKTSQWNVIGLSPRCA